MYHQYLYHHHNISSTTTSSAPTSAATNTTLATKYSVLAYNGIASLELDCPALDGNRYITQQASQTFQLHCKLEWIYDDMGAIFVYTWQDCVEACSSPNVGAVAGALPGVTSGAETCQHAMFLADMFSDVYTKHANCWLKGNESVIPQKDDGRRWLSADLVLGLG